MKITKLEESESELLGLLDVFKDKIKAVIASDNLDPSLDERVSLCYLNKMSWLIISRWRRCCRSYRQ